MENFVILKNEEKKSDKQPDYRVSTKVGDNWETWGACWLKDGKKGKYFSCSKSKPLPPKPAEEPIKYPTDEINPNDIPF